MIEIIVALIGAITTIFTIVWQSRKTNQKLDEHKTTSARNDAKQSILQMMVEDKVDYHLNHKLPENYSRIHEEYDIYHDNGGNGLMTKKIKEYDDWYRQIEKQITK